MLVSVSSLSACEYGRRICSLTEVERKEKKRKGKRLLRRGFEKLPSIYSVIYTETTDRGLTFGEDDVHSKFPVSVYCSIPPHHD